MRMIMSEDMIVAIVLAVVVGGIIVAAIVSDYKKKHKSCSVCGRSNCMTITAEEEVPKGGNNMIFFRTETWTCSKCGHEETVKKTVNYGTRAPQLMSDKRRRELYENE